jgi:lipid-binding SYLF domain-containing protein
MPKHATVVALALVLPAAIPAQAQLREDITVDRATAVLTEMAGGRDEAIPPSLLRGAQGIAIIPNVFKAGFIVGGRFGRGVVLGRDAATGEWSPPVFLTLGGGSFGAQIGAQGTDLILVFRNRRGVESFLMNRGKFTLGADAGVAAGPVGRRFEAGTDARLAAEILSYSRSRGLFAGVSLEGAALALDWRANVLYYGEVRGPAEILNNPELPTPASAARLRSVLSDLTGAPRAARRKDTDPS